MLIADVAARLLLFAVFVTAGVAKLMDRLGSREALVGFGVPRRLALPLGILLPLAELAVAAALLPVATSWLGATGALLLLLAFIAGIAVNLARGRTPDCHCFGQLHSAPVGWSTLARNAGLACAAGFLLWQNRRTPVPSLVSWLKDVTAPQRIAVVSGLVGFTLLAVYAALLLQILRQQGRILIRLDALESRRGGGTAELSEASIAGLPIGSPAPGFSLSGLHGETMTLEALVANGTPLLLLFTNPNCGPCQALMPEVSVWQREHRDKLTIALVSEGAAADNRTKAEAQGVNQVLLQQKREVAEIYQAWGTPAAVLIDRDGAIASPTAQGADAIHALVEQSLNGVRTPRIPAPSIAANGPNGNHQHAPRPRVAKLGDLAPALKLRDLKGKKVALSVFRGQKTVLLFWNPGCGFCQQMLDDLRDWDSAPPAGAPNLVVVSTGTAEDGLAMDLQSPVLLDPNQQVGGVFGANGTPMAVLLDADGRVASEIAAGAQAVFALAAAEASEVQHGSDRG